jgi:hypothetical protein
MEQNTVAHVFESKWGRLGVEEYNYDHFTREDALMDARGTITGRGVGPGCIAPDFELEDTDGNTVRLSSLQGRPVLLRFSSISCPASIGSVKPFKELFLAWGGRVHFLDIFIRQAHPGPMVPAYRSFDQKMHDARTYRDSEELPWPVLVDDLEGRVHQAYGLLPNPAYVLSSEGRIAFYDLWSHAPTVFRALEDLTKPEGACVVRGGMDRMPHVLTYLVNGWPGLARGLPQSYADLEEAVPGLARSIRIGYKLRPVLGTLAMRAKPFPVTSRDIALGASVYLGAKLLSSR